MSKRNQDNKKTNIPSNDGKKLCGAQFLTLDVEMVICSAVLAVYLLSPDHLSGYAVSMVLLVLTVARLDVLCVDA